MAIATTLIANIEANNGKFLEYSKVWNVHNVKGIGTNGSNVKVAIDRLLKSNDSVCVMIGAKGRSQHSATELLIFNVSNMSNSDIKNAGIEYEGHFFTN